MQLIVLILKLKKKDGFMLTPTILVHGIVTSQKKYIDAKLFLLQISDIDDFDFRNSLENKIYSLQRLIAQRKQ